jgi:hypothetical protein
MSGSGSSQSESEHTAQKIDDVEDLGGVCVQIRGGGGEDLGGVCVQKKLTRF